MSCAYFGIIWPFGVGTHNRSVKKFIMKATANVGLKV